MSNSRYKEAYSKNKAFFGKKPSLLIFNNHHLFSKKLPFLDLGCGQGQDLLFMNKMGYRCEGIDQSMDAILQLQDIIKKRKLKNIKVACLDISKFDFSAKVFGVINLRNALQYLEKKDAKEIIGKAQEHIRKGGFIIVSAFTVDDPSAQVKRSGFKSYFKKNELLYHFSKKFFIKYYFEGFIQDKGHGTYPPHKHGIAMIIAQKK